MSAVFGDLYGVSYEIQRVAGLVSAASLGRDARFVGRALGPEQREVVGRIHTLLAEACREAQVLRLTAFPAVPSPSLGPYLGPPKKESHGRR